MSWIFKVLGKAIGDNKGGKKGNKVLIWCNRGNKIVVEIKEVKSVY